ncbi:MAG: molybdenum cofactor guanylyltransferase [Armatimonadota bacterium]
MNIAAAILAGGQSRRMGVDKSSLPSLEDAETTLLQRTVRLAARVFDPVFVVGRPQPENWPPGDCVTFLPDDERNLGPAGGLASLLRYLIHEDDTARIPVALLACDLPLLTLPALTWLKSTAEQNLRRHGLVVRNQTQIEPLFAVYTSEVLPVLEEQLANGKRSLQKLIEVREFTVVDAPPEIRSALVNVNTMEELAHVKSLTPPFKRS